MLIDVHLCCFVGYEVLRMKCDPKGEKHKTWGLIGDFLETTDGLRYTFESDKVTCKSCLKLTGGQ